MPSKKSSPQPAVKIEHISKVYSNGVHALKDVNLTIEKGDFLALLGYNGAGKTTLIGILTGLVNKSSGQAAIFGYDITTEANNAKNMVGVVPQEFNFNIFEKVIDIVVNQAGYFGVSREEALPRAEKILKQLELWDKRDVQSITLSGGMKRRLMIARALIHNPKLLILDEPTAGVDVELRRGMLEYLKKINEDGTTIILTTHYLEEAEQLCKTLAIIKEGEIVRYGKLQELIKGLDTEKYLVDVDTTRGYTKVQGFEVSQFSPDTLEVEIKRGQTLNDFIDELTKNKIKVQGMRAKENRLEELFISILTTK